MADTTKQSRSSSAASQSRHRHASDPGEGTSNKGRRGKAPHKGSSTASAIQPPKPTREELRRHRALEKVVLRAQQQPSTILTGPLAILPPKNSNPSPQRTVSRSQRELSPDRPSSRGPTSSEAEQVFPTLPDPSEASGPEPLVDINPGPSCRVTSPTASPARPEGTLQQDPHATLEAIIARAIQKGLTQGFQQGLLQDLHL